MADKFAKWFSDYQGVATDGFTITPNNSIVFSQPTRAVYIGVAGDIEVQMAASSNTILLFKNAAGLLPIRCSVVRSSNTTATGIIGLF